MGGLSSVVQTHEALVLMVPSRFCSAVVKLRRAVIEGAEEGISVASPIGGYDVVNKEPVHCRLQNPII